MGLEPTTVGLRVQRSTDWASRAEITLNLEYLKIFNLLEGRRAQSSILFKLYSITMRIRMHHFWSFKRLQLPSRIHEPSRKTKFITQRTPMHHATWVINRVQRTPNSRCSLFDCSGWQTATISNFVQISTARTPIIEHTHFVRTDRTVRLMSNSVNCEHRTDQTVRTSNGPNSSFWTNCPKKNRPNTSFRANSPNTKNFESFRTGRTSRCSDFGGPWS